MDLPNFTLKAWDCGPYDRPPDIELEAGNVTVAAKLVRLLMDPEDPAPTGPFVRVVVDRWK